MKPSKQTDKPAVAAADKPAMPSGLDNVKMMHPNGTPVMVTRISVAQFERKGYKVAS